MLTARTPDATHRVDSPGESGLSDNEAARAAAHPP